ncbi:hypothetical protein ERO13_D03G126800v2 [Gossypium hirsutum]|uniref:CSC1-like protein RXW8 isoform X2 n=2 Tax=Gossypium TaxID=3633 RepID=A0ABM2ZUC2_GOSHI|nr:CSC1-like protein RXW8 isoform X2 [Gossypium hirsutum]KAG4155685.1 hypothetical protein ERO13_D03G126800v2 [Gossypium hirsutum]TYH80805.1 hypothetical protein ES332_D03G157400v1 [Gossypium tomentosum]
MIIDQILPQTFFPLCWFPKFSFPSAGEIGALYPISFPHFRLSKLFSVLCSSFAGLTQLEHLDQLSRRVPFLKGILKQEFIHQVVTGYLPSVILILFLYAVPPTMMLFSAIEGNISRSQRKWGACIKVLYFTIWNVFFVNVLFGSIIRQLTVFSSFKDAPKQLARAVPTHVTFPCVLNCWFNKTSTPPTSWLPSSRLTYYHQAGLACPVK